MSAMDLCPAARVLPPTLGVQTDATEPAPRHMLGIAKPPRFC